MTDVPIKNEKMRNFYDRLDNRTLTKEDWQKSKHKRRLQISLTVEALEFLDSYCPKNTRSTIIRFIIYGMMNPEKREQIEKILVPEGDFIETALMEMRSKTWIEKSVGHKKELARR